MSNAYSSLRKFYSRHCVGFTYGKSSMLHILLCYCGFTFYTLLSVIITQHFLQCNKTTTTTTNNNDNKHNSNNNNIIMVIIIMIIIIIKY